MDSLHKRSEASLITQVIDLLEGQHLDVLADLLAREHATELAILLESLPQDQRRRVWELMPGSQQGEVLLHLHDEARHALIAEMPNHELAEALEDLDADDIAFVLEDVPEAKSHAVLGRLDQETRADVEEALSYPEGTAGRVMRFDTIEVREDVDLYTVLRYLRRHKQLPDHTDGLMVVNDDGHYLGKLSLATLVTHPGSVRVADAMQRGADVISVHMAEDALAQLFDRRDLVSVAVVDDEGKLVGRITVDDVLDIVKAQSERTLMELAGLDEATDLFAPVLTSARRRAIWLGLNLATASLAAWVIGRFEDTISQIVALAILMPIVASMGGVAGSQSLTLTVRGLALGQVSVSNFRWLLGRQVAIGLLNGLLWAGVMGAVTGVLFTWGIGAVIAAALIIILLIGSVTGVVIPVLLDRLGVDPALSASMILMTITDVMGFFSFLGLASLFLL